MRRIIIAEQSIGKGWQKSFMVGEGDVQLTLTEEKGYATLDFVIDNDNGDGGERLTIEFSTIRPGGRILQLFHRDGEARAPKSWRP